MDKMQAQVIKHIINKHVILKIGEKERIKNRTSTKQKNKCGVNQN
jgi:translation initiation factor IF-1